MRSCAAARSQETTSSNWDATLKEDRPLCSNRHFCTIKDPQHWVEYKHSTSTAEVMAKLRNPRAQGATSLQLFLVACLLVVGCSHFVHVSGKHYGSNTLDVRSRVRPTQQDNP